MYRTMMRAQRRGTHGTDAKTWMLLLALVAMAGSAVYWWGVQSQLTDNKVVAGAFTAILVLAPPILVSFLIPWSPGGMLLQKVNARTWGFFAVVGCSLYLVYYSVQLQLAWWSAQPVVADSGLVYQQVFIGIIGFIVIPALLWTPVSDEELQERVKQAHLVKRYQMQTAADIAILDATLLRAQEKALVGFANLTAGEQEELAAVMNSLVSGIDRTLQQIAGNMNAAAETVYGEHGRDIFSAPPLADEMHEILSYVGKALGDSRMQLAASDHPSRSIPSQSDGTRSEAHASIGAASRSIPSQSDGTRPGQVIQDDPGSSWIVPDQSIRAALTAASAHLGPAPMDDDTRAAIEVLPTAGAALVARGFTDQPWMVSDLAAALHIGEPTARKIAAIWVEHGAVIRGPAKGLAKGRYQFAEVRR